MRPMAGGERRSLTGWPPTAQISARSACSTVMGRYAWAIRKCVLNATPAASPHFPNAVTRMSPNAQSCIPHRRGVGGIAAELSRALQPSQKRTALVPAPTTMNSNPNCGMKANFLRQLSHSLQNPEFWPRYLCCPHDAQKTAAPANDDRPPSDHC